jgi:hypothetical protein
VVVLQEQSLRPVIDRQAMHQYARLLNAEIKQRGAKTVFYLTWARQHIPEMQAGADPATSPAYARAMFEVSGAEKTTDFDTWCQPQKPGLAGGLNRAYFDIAQELGADVAPVGIAWQMALAAEPPFVLHKPDNSHPNPAGTYLAACVFYATLLEASCPCVPSVISISWCSLWRSAGFWARHSGYWANTSRSEVRPRAQLMTASTSSLRPRSRRPAHCEPTTCR